MSTFCTFHSSSSQQICHLNERDKRDKTGSSKCQECTQTVFKSVRTGWHDKPFSVTNCFLYFRYEKNLVEAKDFGVKKAITTNVSMGLTQFIIFGTYALAFWYGTKLSVDEPENYTIGRVITVSLLNSFYDFICFWIKIQQEKFLNNHQLCYFWSQVFFSVMIGSFSLGQGAPNLESIAKARGAAYEVYKTIDMVQTFSLCSIFTIKLFFY